MRGLPSQIKIGHRRHAGFCAAAILLLAVLVAHAERLPVRVYTSADGLGSSASFNLVRDRRGFIWLCSRDGLVRFDGYRFRHGPFYARQAGGKPPASSQAALLG
jgi:ligand-binding sensor domain-containing protein